MFVSNTVRMGQTEMTGLQVRVLGDIAVTGSGARSVAGPTQRRVLALLTARRNEITTIDQLVDACWPDGDVPERAEHNIRTYVHRLRGALGEHDERIETSAGGYRFQLADDETDLRRFEQIAGEATRLVETRDLGAALDRFDEAAALWRGRPYAEFAEERWAQAESARLVDVRVTMLEHRAEALLEAGSASEAVVVLEDLVREEPYRERPRSLLMRALYESGRQAEALRAFQDYRRFLIDDAGVEPSDRLVELDREIAANRLGPVANRPRVVGNYELHERIGEGAFAVVHRATQSSLGREVAVKIVRAELANRPEFVRRFEAEAQMVASIEHPNVVPLYDYWREPGHAYLVMRWMTGGSLETRLDGGGLGLDAVTGLVDQIGAALDAAHGHDVVHRDVKPANILFDEAGRAYLGDFGIALAAEERSTPHAALSEGSPIFASPEQLRREPAGPEADVHALGIVAFTALTGRTPFHDAADEAELLRRQLREPIPSVSSITTGIPAELDEVIAIATAKDAHDRYPTAGAFATAFRAAAGGILAVPAPAIRTGTNPYLGLRAFSESDAAAFHGRARLVDELVAACTDPDRRFLAVVGPSGSGKSSVVRAGLVPALRAGRSPGSARWFVTTMVPGARPFEALETALLRVAVNPPSALLDQLRDGDRGIHRGVSRLVPDGADTVLVVIDQFEELFTATDEAERLRFLRAIATAVTEPRGSLRVVATMRADFYDQPLRHPEFAQLFKDSVVAITPLAPDELEESITAPAAGVGMTFEPGLVAEIVADVNSQPGALPLLQYALTQSFDASDGAIITTQAYHEVGGLTGALARRAEMLQGEANGDERTAIRRLFGRLVTLGDGSDDTRRRVRISELPIDGATERMIERFGDARLLTFDRDPGTREPTVEVAHEALLRAWPRLRAWLDEDREMLRMHRHLTASATSWAERDSDPNELYRGDRLVAAEALAASAVVTLNDTEASFVVASAIARDAAAAAERGRIQRLHRLVAVTAVVAAVALVAGAVALWQRGRADEQAARAVRSAATAESAQVEAEDAAAAAVREAAAADAARMDADTQAERAESEAEAATAARAAADIDRLKSQAVAISEEQPAVAALLAVEASRLDPSRATDDALQRVLTALPGYRGHLPAFSFPSLLAADGTTLAAFGLDWEIWDLVTQTRLHSITPDVTSVGAAAFSPDATKIAYSNPDGTVVYDVASGELLASNDVWFGAIEFSTDSTQLAGSTSEIQILDALTLAPIRALPANVDTLDWSDVDDVIVTSGGGAIQAWDPSTGAIRWETTFSHLLAVTTASSFSPDGRRVTIATQEFLEGGPESPYRLRTFDVDAGDQLFEPTVPSERFSSMTALDERGDVVAGIALGEFNAVPVYDLTSGTGASSPLPALGAAIFVGYSPPRDLFFTSGNSGVDLWSRDGSSPLERRVPLPEGWISSTGDGTTWTDLSDDGNTLTVSNLDRREHVTYDLRSNVPTPLPGEGARRGYGTTTLSVSEAGIQLLDDNDAPLGPAVPVPDDVNGGDPWAASRDGRFFAVGHGSGVVELYRADGTHVGALTVPDALGPRPTWVTMSDDGSLVAAFLQGLNQAFAIWDTSTLEVVQSGAGFDHLRYFLSGDVLYASRIDLAVIDRLDPRTLEPVGDPLVGHTYALIGATTDTTNDLVSTIAVDLSARVWDATTGEQVGRALPFTGGNETRFSDDGKLLVVPGSESISIWNMDTSTWPDIACEVAGRNLSRTEWERLGPRSVDYRATCPQYPIED
jgi:DNA-binding SARP family transcriptional activator/WD40 repeat protein/type II secretory pathway predicted ATPase ExeA